MITDESYADAWNAGYNDGIAGNWNGEEYEHDEALLQAYEEGYAEAEYDIQLSENEEDLDV